jgi:hypothetical protein
MVRLGEFLYRAGWAISGLLLFYFPPTIFAYSGFVARLTNVGETIEIGVACTAIACLSWLAGWGMGFLLARICKVESARQSDRTLNFRQLRARHPPTTYLRAARTRESRQARKSASVRFERKTRLETKALY